jgi:hypothetical protein
MRATLLLDLLQEKGRTPKNQRIFGWGTRSCNQNLHLTMYLVTIALTESVARQAGNNTGRTRFPLYAFTVTRKQSVNARSQAGWEWHLPIGGIHKE